MKTVLAFALLVGAALAHTGPHYHGWTPEQEFTFRWAARADSGVPQIRAGQRAGVTVAAAVVVQTFSDFTLRVRVVDPVFSTYNEGSQVPEGAPVPPEWARSLEQPFEVNLKGGHVEEFMVERDEPVEVTNVKRALLSQFQVEIAEHFNPVAHSSENAFFKAHEKGINGDCETRYNIRKFTPSEIMEYESNHEPEHGYHCVGKKYWEIVKTKNYDNCKARPVYQSTMGIKTDCDFSKSMCNDGMISQSSTRYVVCGISLYQYVFRSVHASSAIQTPPLQWNTNGQALRSKADIILELQSIKNSGFKPMPTPHQPKTIKSLLYGYPDGFSSSSSSSAIETSGQKLPMPGLDSGETIIPPYVPYGKLRQEIMDAMKDMVKEILSKDSSSCAKRGDIAGQVPVVATALRTLTTEQLREVEVAVMQQFTDPKEAKAARELYVDLLTMAGSNATFRAVRAMFQDSKIPARKRTMTIRSALRNLRTPTPAVLSSALEFVSHLEDKSSYEFNTGMLHLANLAYDACVNPATRFTKFPVQIYGTFCSPDDQFVSRELISFLSNQLTKDGKKMKAGITALGKTGHKAALVPLAKAIEGKFTSDPLTRSMAVYSLKRLARREPALVREIVTKLVANLAETTEVRIAAVAVLPYTQPGSEDLQKVAARSWFEPSKQVGAFVYSTLKSLAETDIPELQIVSDKAAYALTLVKPFQTGVQYSQTLQTSKFFQYLLSGIDATLSYAVTEKAILPARVSVADRMFGAVWQLDRITFTAYTKGMDKYIDTILSGHSSPILEEIRQQLQGMDAHMGIGNKGQEKPEAVLESKLFGYESLLTLDEPDLVNAISGVLSELRSLPAEGKSYDLTGVTALNLYNLEYIAPTETGFPAYIVKTAPVVARINGRAKISQVSGNTNPKAEIRAISIVDTKIQSNLGVFCPFNGEFAAAGVDFNLHLNLPADVRASYDTQTSKVELSLRALEPSQEKIEAFHILVKPYTMLKDVTLLTPASKAKDIKVILSGDGEKTIKHDDLGERVGISASFDLVTDERFVDFAHFWNGLTQYSLAYVSAAPEMAWSSRHTDLLISFSPVRSQAKEIDFSFILYNKLSSVSEIIPVQSESEIHQLTSERISDLQSSLGSDSSLTGVHLQSGIVSIDGSRKAIETVVIAGKKAIGDKVYNAAAEILFKSPQTPVYRIRINSKNVVPSMPIRWDLESLLSQPLSLHTSTSVDYGHVGAASRTATLSGVLSKSSDLSAEVRASNEYRRCQKEIARGLDLASVCEETRHQAASVDAADLTLTVPAEIYSCPYFVRGVEYLKSLYLGQIVHLENENDEPSEPGKFSVKASINRIGDTVQVSELVTPRSRLAIRNIRVPYMLRRLAPLSLRNGITTRLLQDVTRDQVPESCRLNANTISTFDNKTYTFDLSRSGCEFALVKDCRTQGQKSPVAVTAKQQQQGGPKVMTFVTGIHRAVLSKESGQVKVEVDGTVKRLTPGVPAVYKNPHNNKVNLELVQAEDGVVHASCPEHGVEAFYYGEYLEVAASYAYYNRLCGLCGDMNGENTADLTTPGGRCVVHPERVAALAFLVDPHCPNAPRDDLKRLREQTGEHCAPKRDVPTRVEGLAQRLTSLGHGPRPLTVKHIVETRPDLEAICFSRRPVPTCPQGTVPAGTARTVQMDFACLPESNVAAQQLRKRALAGDVLEEVQQQPAVYAKSVTAAKTCGEEEQQQGGLGQSWEASAIVGY